MRTKQLSDVAIGLVFAAGGLGIFIQAAGFRSMPGMIVGSGLFPMITGVGMVLFGVALAASGLLRSIESADAPSDSAPSDPQRRFLSLPVYSLLVLAALAALTLLIPGLGFIVCGVVFTALVTRLGGAGWLGSVIFAVLITFALYAVFVHGLRVPLPRGQFGF